MNKSIIYIAVTLLMLSFFACNQSRKEVDKGMSKSAISADSCVADNRGYSVNVGEMAPDFEMQLPDGKRVCLSSLRGKIVMLQFTASWCGVCRKEMPDIEREIWQTHRHNPDFVLFGIDREESIGKINELKKATGITYPVALDLDASIFRLYAEKGAGITRNVIIDKEGRIRMLTRLYDKEEFARMVQLINALLT